VTSVAIHYLAVAAASTLEAMGAKDESVAATQACDQKIARGVIRTLRTTPLAGWFRAPAQASMNSASSLSSADFGRAPTTDRTTWPFW